MAKNISIDHVIQSRPSAPVALVKTQPEREKVFEDVSRAMELAGWKNFISAGADVSLKPNLGWDKLVPGAISAPWVVEGVILAIKGHVGKIHVVESDQVVVNVRDSLRISGVDAICKRQGVTWVNMSQGEFVEMRSPDRLVLHHMRIPEILTRTELITLPLLKTHNKSTVTGAIKNQWGCLETLRHNFHPVLTQALVDVNTMVQPRFAVMDGTVALEGNGPKSGISKEMNLILASGNLVGLDSTGARIMGFDPAKIDHLTLCAANGFGAVDGFEVIGEKIADHATRFVPARHNAVSFIEIVMRRPLIERLIFHTPVFNLMCWGARRFYDLWDWRVGQHQRREFFARSKYSEQWQ